MKEGKKLFFILGFVLLLSLSFMNFVVADEHVLTEGGKSTYYSNWGYKIESILKVSSGDQVKFIIFDGNGNEVLGGPFEITSQNPIFSYGPLTLDLIEIFGEVSETDSPYVKRYQKVRLDAVHNDEIANVHEGKVIYKEGDHEFLKDDSFEIKGVIGNIMEISYALSGDTEPRVIIQDDSARIYNLHEGEIAKMVYGSNINPESKNLRVEVLTIDKEESSAILRLTSIDEIIEPIEEPEDLPSEEIVYFCMGCEFGEKCYPYGFRLSENYCDSESEQFVSQKSDFCNNNFECVSNLCVDSECIEAGLFKKIMNWFKRVFLK